MRLLVSIAASLYIISWVNGVLVYVKLNYPDQLLFAVLAALAFFAAVIFALASMHGKHHAANAVRSTALEAPEQ